MKTLPLTFALTVAIAGSGLAQAAPCVVLHDEDDALTADQEAEALEQMRQALLAVGLILGPAPCEDPYVLAHRRRGEKLWISLVAPWENKQILLPSTPAKRASTYPRLARTIRSAAPPAVYLQTPGSLAEEGAMFVGELTGRYEGVPAATELASEPSVAAWDERKEKADRWTAGAGAGLLGGVTAMKGAALLPTFAGSAKSEGGGPLAFKSGLLWAMDTRKDAIQSDQQRCLWANYVVESALSAELSMPVGNGRPHLAAGISFYAQCVEATGRNLGLAGPHLDAGWTFRNEGRVRPIVQVTGTLPVGPFNVSDERMPWVGLQAGLWIANR